MHSRLQPLREDARAAEQRSVAQILTDVVSNLQDILAGQIRLAQAHARAELRSFRPAATLILVGVLGGLLSALFLLLAFVAALSLVMSVWLAAVIVALGMAVLCVLTLRAGTRRARRRAANIAGSVEEKAPWTAQPRA